MFDPGSSLSTGAKLPVAPGQSAPVTSTELSVNAVLVGMSGSGVQEVDRLGGDRSSWRQQALWRMEPTSFHEAAAAHHSMLSPLSPVASPVSQAAQMDKVDLMCSTDFHCIFITSPLPLVTNHQPNLAVVNPSNDI